MSQENQSEDGKYGIKQKCRSRPLQAKRKTQRRKKKKRNPDENPEETVEPVVFFHLTGILQLDLGTAPKMHWAGNYKCIDSNLYEYKTNNKTDNCKDDFFNHKQNPFFVTLLQTSKFASQIRQPHLMLPT